MEIQLSFGEVAQPKCRLGDSVGWSRSDARRLSARAPEWAVAAMQYKPLRKWAGGDDVPVRRRQHSSRDQRRGSAGADRLPLCRQSRPRSRSAYGSRPSAGVSVPARTVPSVGLEAHANHVPRCIW